MFQNLSSVKVNFGNNSQNWLSVKFMYTKLKNWPLTEICVHEIVKTFSNYLTFQHILKWQGNDKELTKKVQGNYYICFVLVITCFRGKFGINLPSSLFCETREISKFYKMNEVNFSQISLINMWFLVNHMWKPSKSTQG